MRLTVKVLNGEECTIAASPSSYVTDIKDQVAALLSIPVSDQKMLYHGKTMTDGKTLSEYSVKDGGKLMVVVKPGSAAPGGRVTKPEPVVDHSSSPVWSKLQQFLRRHFTEKDADLVLVEFKRDFDKGLSTMSLDDIERLAATKLRAVSER